MLKIIGKDVQCGNGLQFLTYRQAFGAVLGCEVNLSKRLDNGTTLIC